MNGQRFPNLINEIAIFQYKIKVILEQVDEGYLQENVIILIVGAFSYFAPTVNNFALFMQRTKQNTRT